MQFFDVLLPAILLFVLALSASGSNSESSRDSQVVLVPIGSISPELTSWLQQNLPGILGLQVTTVPALTIPQRAYNSTRSHYLGDAVLADLQAEVHSVSSGQRLATESWLKESRTM